VVARELFQDDRNKIHLFLSNLPRYLQGRLQVSSIFLCEDDGGMELVISCPSPQVAMSICFPPRARRLASSARDCKFKRVTILAGRDEAHNCFCRTLPVQSEPVPMARQGHPHRLFKIMPQLTTEQQLLEVRSRKHHPLIRAIGQGVVCVTVHDANESTGFAYLDVFAPLTERLNKQRNELIGKPVDFLPPAIAEPRLHALRNCITTGGHVSYRYTYEDEYTWKFNVEVAPIYGTEEIVTIVRDAEAWQPGHWVNKRKQVS
jgi:hypothetical protein